MKTHNTAQNVSAIHKQIIKEEITYTKDRTKELKHNSIIQMIDSLIRRQFGDQITKMSLHKEKGGGSSNRRNVRNRH